MRKWHSQKYEIEVNISVSQVLSAAALLSQMSDCSSYNGVRIASRMSSASVMLTFAAH